MKQKNIEKHMEGYRIIREVQNTTWAKGSWAKGGARVSKKQDPGILEIFSCDSSSIPRGVTDWRTDSAKLGQKQFSTNLTTADDY